jgi:hypothetical protein
MKPTTLGDIINQSRLSIDDADPTEWSRAAQFNYQTQKVSAPMESYGINKEERITDEVEKPAHYNYGKYETIDVIVDTLGDYEAINYCHGNVLKYTIRMWHKGNPVKDIKKAIWYANKMVELLERTKDKNW